MKENQHTLIKRFSEKYIRFLSKHYILLIVFYLLISVFFGMSALKIKLNSRIYDLFPQKLQSMQDSKKMENYYGGEGYLLISVNYTHPEHFLLESLEALKNRTQSRLESTQKLFSQYKEDKIHTVSSALKSSLKQLLKDYKYYDNALQFSLKNSSKSHYTPIFIQELKENIIPDTIAKVNNLLDLQNTASFLLLSHTLSENMRAFNLYEDTVFKTFPPNVEERLKKAAELVVNKIQKRKDYVIFADYKYNQQFVEDHLLLFLDQEDLKNIHDKLQDKINYERRKNIIASSLLIDKDTGNLSFNDIENKYTSKQGGSGKFFRLIGGFDFLNTSKSKEKDRYYIGKTRDKLIILVKPTKGSADIGFSKKLIDYTTKTLEIFQKKYHNELKNITFTQGGRYVDRVADSQILAHDFKVITPISLIFVFIIIGLYFRRIRAIFIVSTPLLSGILWAVGIVHLIIGHFNIVSSFLIAIISGLGVNFSTHLYSRYYEERKKGKDVEESLITVFQTTFISNVTATLTTAVGFAVLAFSAFKGFSEFGIIASIGMLCLLVGIILVFPSLVTLTEKIKPLQFKIQSQDNMNLEKYKNRPFPFYRQILLLAIIFTFVALIGVIHAHFNANFLSLVEKAGFYKMDTDISDETQNILGLFNFVPMPIYTKDIPTMEKVTKYLLKEHDAAEKEGNIYKSNYKVESLYNYVPEDQKEKMVLIKSIRKLLDKDILKSITDKKTKTKIDRLRDLTDVGFVTYNDIPQNLYHLFLGKKPGYFILYYPTSSISDTKWITSFSKNLKEISKKYAKEGVFVASDTIIFNDILTIIKKEGPIIFIFIALSFAFMLWLDFRSWKYVATALAPLCLGILWLFGFFYLFGLEFNYFNVLMFPVIAGLGIDYGVHFLHRYQEEGSRNLFFIFSTTGKAMWVAAFEDMIGFGTLILALYSGLVSIGQFLMIGVFSCLLVASLVLPAAFQLVFNIRKEGFKKALFGDVQFKK